MAKDEPRGAGADDSNLSTEMIHLTKTRNSSGRNRGSGAKLAHGGGELGRGFDI